MHKGWERALVTGASSGIGESFARILAARGTDLVLVARRAVVLDALADEMRDRHGVEVEVIPADLTDADQIRTIEARLMMRDRPIDLLVNNAGGGTPGPGYFFKHDLDLLENQMVLNAVSVMRLTHAALSSMTDLGRGNVIQVSAGVGFYPTPWGATYAASKAFVTSLSRAVEFELAGTDVHVTAVCPGFTRTEAPARNGFNEGNIPKRLWADPEEVVEAALDAAAKGKPMVSPAFVNKVAAAFGSHFPNVMLRAAGKLGPLRKAAEGTQKASV
jgi:short-subunit dehydrogenase